MTDHMHPSESAHHGSHVAKWLRSRFMAGLVFVVPIWVTIIVVRFVFHFLRDTSLWLIEALLLSGPGEPLLVRWGLDRAELSKDGISALPLTVDWCVGLLSVILTIVLVYVLGVVATNVLGRRLIRIVEGVVDRVPLVKVVYYASKKVLETFAGGETRPFQQVVLVPFPTDAMQSIGLVTHVGRDQQTGEPIYSIFVAMAPHLTSGFVVVTPASNVVELDWSVEQALKVIISGGMLMPDSLPFPASGFRQSGLDQGLL